MHAPNDALIAQRAHEIYSERQRTGRAGDALSDWLGAERELVTLDPDGQARHSPLAALNALPTKERRREVARLTVKPIGDRKPTRRRAPRRQTANA